MKDIISIAMTTYNGAKCLREQLDSLYSQTLIPDEIVVVDDCSTDNTTKILEEYLQKHGLIYYINESNLGVNKNFEKAIGLCTGDYVALCDQDDVWLPHKIETSYKKIKTIENNEPALVSSRNISVDENLKIISTPKADDDSFDYSKTLLGHFSQGCTLMMNRKLIKNIIPIPEDKVMFFDMYIGLVAAMIGNKYIISEPLMLYRSHSNNVLANDVNMNKSILKRFYTKYNNKYPGLLPNERFLLMEYVKNKHYHQFINDRIPLFNRLLSLNKNINLLKAIKTIYPRDCELMS